MTTLSLIFHLPNLISNFLILNASLHLLPTLFVFSLSLLFLNSSLFVRLLQASLGHNMDPLLTLLVPTWCCSFIVPSSSPNLFL